MSSPPPPHSNWLTFTLTAILIGLVSYETAFPKAEDMVRQADLLMYEIKKEGKNGIKSRTV